MRGWRFLQYELPYLVLFAVAYMIIAIVSFTDPETAWSRETFLYTLLLMLLLVAGFLVHRYLRNVHAIKHMQDEDAEPLSLEAEAYQEAIAALEKEHIRALNSVRAQQNEYYDFILSWFHEIKTPISVLRLMQQTEIDPKSLEEELSRIEHYVDQALYYAKLDSFNQDYEIRNCTLEQLVKDAVRTHSKTFISKRIRIVLQLDPALVVQSDPKWLQFIIHQLITNSLKYTPDQGEITVATRSTAQEKQLVLRDSGIGIEPKDLPRIFNRGFTGSNGRSHMKSTGMGLYLAQALSNKLGHYITATSAVGAFTEMVIHFPRNHDPFLQVVKGVGPD
ncbi:sensor histidine kinase [Paenibacillus koleovorans]|uniref:sensor histidine kinase n=1 Tax=Paenibacillus koleovorans TaxID=121608 RepID=UPI000FD72A5D|nr:sensor histidine kinase [Paenibacillus koleovorans]